MPACFSSNFDFEVKATTCTLLNFNTQQVPVGRGARPPFFVVDFELKATPRTLPKFQHPKRPKYAVFKDEHKAYKKAARRRARKTREFLADPRLRINPPMYSLPQ